MPASSNESTPIISCKVAGVADIVRPATLVASQAAIDALTARAAKDRVKEEAA